LYFWHLAEEMGVLKNVLNVLSAEVSADTDNAPNNTAAPQRNRRSRISGDDEREEDRAAKKKFRAGVQSSLKVIGDGLRDANILTTIVNTRSATCAEEDRVHQMLMKILICTPEEKKPIFEEIKLHHSKPAIATYEEELARLVAKRDKEVFV
jgi:hypothetical protein